MAWSDMMTTADAAGAMSRVFVRTFRFRAKHQVIELRRQLASAIVKATHFTAMPPPRLLSPLLRARLQPSYQCLRRIPAVRHASTSEPTPPPSALPWKTPQSIEAWPPAYMIPPPKDGEVLLERKPNRELPPSVSPTPSTAPHPQC